MKRISASYIYTLENFEPIVNGFVEVEDDGTVIRTGKCEDISKEQDFHEGVILPGFVNSHCHIELSHLWKKFRKGTGMAGFIDQINALRDWADNEKKAVLVREWMQKMWDRGVSAMADISNDESSFVPKSESPMYTRTFLEVFGSEPEQCAQVMKDVTALNALADKAGIDAAPTPHSCYTMSPDLLTASAEAGLKSGFLSYHSQESQEEEDMILSGSGALYDNRIRLGMSVPPVLGKPSLFYFIERLEKIHPAPFEENILLVHNVRLTQDAVDLATAKLCHPFFALCPLSNIFIHNALPPVELMRKNGLKITVGTDSLSSNDDLDMAAEVACLKKNFPEVSLGEILTWACRNGAEFLRKESVYGQILPGMKPGIVLLEGLTENGIEGDVSSKRLI